MRVLASVCVLCLATLTACGGGSEGSSSSHNLLSGNWQMELQLTPTSMKTESGFLMQSGESLTGNVVISGETNCPGVGSVQGKISGSNVAITVNQIGQTVQFTGTAAADGATITGDYAILAAGCGSTQTGTWNASRVQPLNGNFVGTFTSEQAPGLTYDVSAAVSQGPNTASSTASLSGTITSSQAPCFANLSFSGLISGTSVVFNLVTEDGAAVGQFRPTASLDAKTLTGIYQFNFMRGVCSGDYGTATMALQ